MALVERRMQRGGLVIDRIDGGSESWKFALDPTNILALHMTDNERLCVVLARGLGYTGGKAVLWIGMRSAGPPPTCNLVIILVLAKEYEKSGCEDISTWM